ncbi:phosphoribosylformylglycinamidine cyclo-ligase [Helicobacter monodelphidis]|uniref:phosphoribosylformylglycinamidine cyclo-ligase n=1 Tax=Helicobacter sp. 15-1451 TaxID=2004995 RepID=UPI000DCD2329|nr:phosphoribosylformylglycinamidine cyclo-ligase [Helicobacter sp. 15-1451]RAX58885.1 phosphoribosylformylglycinamidine cyclo-ligase [Helicobacter sp. 15-1451]
MKELISYAQAGVNIAEGNRLVEKIKPLAKSTAISGVLGGIGCFAGAFEIPQGYRQPVLFAATDGVGTKLKLAIEHQSLKSVGIDLVAMCVNDLICNFATPLFFLDYYATGALNVEEATGVIEGIAKGCIEAECALIGGETAEMPGMYQNNDFDLAGFSVGIAEKQDLDKEKIKCGDILVGIPSSGLHSNGYSLVRKIIQTRQLDLQQNFNGKTLLETFLEPTRIYVKLFKEIKNDISALAHITGGGIIENLPRILLDGQCAIIEKKAIPTQPIFELLRENVAEEEAYKTFNMGVGMILAIDKQKAEKVASLSGGVILGEVKSGLKGVHLT